RPVPPLPPPDPFSPADADEERCYAETDPDESEARHTTEDLWTLIDDPTTWHDWPDPTEPPNS
ncbi:MAG: hypothetical protein QOE99_1190, partial [Actinomycetota bacterium]|nr:hypothetical protein [Actinomycetota bacterium]